MNRVTHPLILPCKQGRTIGQQIIAASDQYLNLKLFVLEADRLSIFKGETGERVNKQ